ncbi:eukaryotic translation initiation factor 4 gamma 1-like [Megalops cyprinoides]|uniref:eukaryotic translation initiation factor 4 gamma 1-like n=1 Tax=Megalops cyprinoides TaxID=118141 RepID=UPI001864EDB7|nr:eukaryotic translation initiation factor 4 gamma 1-like [Megalops cyprinoides]
MGGRDLSQPGQRSGPQKIITGVSFSGHVQLHRTENAWKPASKMQVRGGEDRGAEDREEVKTKELFGRVRSILNKLTPEMFQQLVKQMIELTIDTAERLTGVVDIIFEKAISEPHFSGTYANMCHCLRELNVPTSSNAAIMLNFRSLLLNFCRMEFEKVNKDHRRSLGNVKFISELYRVDMVKEAIVHMCITTLLENRSEEALECLCCLLSNVGRKLEFENSKPRVDQYFRQVEWIVKEGKTTSRIRFKLQDLMDLRQNNWVPRRGDQGPKMIIQVHKEAELEKEAGRVEVQQHLLLKEVSNGRGGPFPAYRGSGLQQGEGKRTIPTSAKCSPVIRGKLGKTIQPSEMGGPSLSQQAQFTEPHKVVSTVAFGGDVQLHIAGNAWKPADKKLAGCNQDRGVKDPEAARTEELFGRVRSILNKLTPEMFQQLAKQMTELTIDTAERLMGVVDIIFEKAISEPHFSGTYANMCHCLRELNVPTGSNAGVTVNFRLLLLNRCRKEFEKGSEDGKNIRKKTDHRRRSLGNIKFISELYRVDMVKEAIVHMCITTLLENRSEEALECLCCLLSNVGRKLECENSKPRVDQYFRQVEWIVKEGKTSSRIRFKLQDLMDLRQDLDVPAA